MKKKIFTIFLLIALMTPSTVFAEIYGDLTPEPGEPTYQNEEALNALPEKAIACFKEAINAKIGGQTINIANVRYSEELNELDKHSISIEFDAGEGTYLFVSEDEGENGSIIKSKQKKPNGTVTLQYHTNLELDGMTMTIYLWNDELVHQKEIYTSNYHKKIEESFELPVGKYRVQSIVFNDKKLPNYNCYLNEMEFEIRRNENTVLQLYTDEKETTYELKMEDFPVTVKSNCDIKTLQVLTKSNVTKAINPLTESTYSLASAFELSQGGKAKLAAGSWDVVAVNGYNKNGTPISVYYPRISFNTDSEIVLYAIDNEVEVPQELKDEIANAKASAKTYAEKPAKYTDEYMKIEPKVFDLEKETEKAEYEALLKRLNCGYDMDTNKVDESQKEEVKREVFEQEKKKEEEKKEQNVPFPLMFVMIGVLLAGGAFFYYKKM